MVSCTLQSSLWHLFVTRLNLFLWLPSLSVGRGGWPAQIQMQRNCSGWWERSSFSGPNPTWVFQFCVVFDFLLFCESVLCHETLLLIVYFVIYCRTLNERSRTLWLWTRSTTCLSWLLTVRARWARWEGTNQWVAKLNLACYLIRCFNHLLHTLGCNSLRN